MSSTVFKVVCYRLEVPDRPGEALRLLMHFKEAGVGLLAMCGESLPGGRARLEIVPEYEETLRRAAARMPLELGPPVRAFLFQEGERIGAAADCFGRLASRGVNVVASHAVAAGAGRWGMVVHVASADYDRACEVLGF